MSKNIRFSFREDFSEIIKISVISIDFSHREHEFALAILEIHNTDSIIYPTFLQIGTFFQGRFLREVKNKNTNSKLNKTSIIYIASAQRDLAYMKNIADHRILLCHSFTHEICTPDLYKPKIHTDIKILEITENQNNQIPHIIKIKKNIKNEIINEIPKKYTLRISYENYDLDKANIDQFLSIIKGKINIMSQGNRDKEMCYMVNFTLQSRTTKHTTFFQIILNENGMGKRDFPDFCRNEQILQDKLQRMVNVETIKIKIILDTSIFLYDTLKYKEKIYRVSSIEHHISKSQDYTIIEAVFERKFLLESIDEFFEDPEITTKPFLSLNDEDISLNSGYDISVAMLKNIKVNNPSIQEKQNHYSISKLMIL